jgi:flagellar L-ring protein precursor FlgH
MSGARHVWTLLLGCFVLCAQAHSADVSTASNWSSLASDRVARNVGDVLTVVVYENSTATDSAESTVAKSSSFQGAITAGNPNTPGVSEAASLGLGHSSDNAGTTTRTGTMVGQISVTVDALLPNGDIHISGAQVININGERTRIAVKGRVRLADVSASNVIISTSLADATIDYDGAGLVSESSKAGILTRALNWLGIP